MSEKELIEKRNELINKIENIINTAKAENRIVNDEEKTKFEELEKEVKSIDDTITMIDKASKMELRKVPSLEEKMSEEEKDIHNFANLIRNFSNSGELTKGDNGVVIPQTIAQKIIDKVIEISPLFAKATKYNAKGTLIIPKVDTATDDVTVAYATEFSDLTSHSNKFASISLTGFLIGALTKISKSLLNNSDFTLTSWVINRMADKFKLFYEQEFIYGTTNKIAGIVGSYDATNMKKTLAAKSSLTADELIDIQEQLPDVYQADAMWIMNRATRKAIRKLKNSDGDYLLNKVFGLAWDYELLGKPVYCSEKVKTLGTAANEVIFYGDFSGLAIKISEDMQISILTELYATQHAIGICGYTEIDAKIENTQKIVVAVAGASDPS